MPTSAGTAKIKSPHTGICYGENERGTDTQAEVSGGQQHNYHQDTGYQAVNTDSFGFRFQFHSHVANGKGGNCCDEVISDNSKGRSLGGGYANDIGGIGAQITAGTGSNGISEK